MRWNVKPCACTGNIAVLFRLHYCNSPIDDFYKMNDRVRFIGSPGANNLVKRVAEVLQHLLGFCSFRKKLRNKSMHRFYCLILFPFNSYGGCRRTCRQRCW